MKKVRVRYVGGSDCVRNSHGIWRRGTWRELSPEEAAALRVGFEVEEIAEVAADAKSSSVATAKSADAPTTGDTSQPDKAETKETK